MLIADKRDYRKGYKKHYELYKRLKSNNSDINSRRLLLVYSVECGLKYMLLDKWREDDEKVEDVDNVVGLESLAHFGEYEDDSVFVRNDRLKCDYEILLDQRTYSDVIKQRPHQTEV